MGWSTGLVVALSIAVAAAGCGSDEDGPPGGTGASAAAGSGATGTGGGSGSGGSGGTTHGTGGDGGDGGDSAGGSGVTTGGTGGTGGGTGGSGGEEPTPTSLDLRGDPTFQVDELDDSAADQFGVTHRAWYQRMRNSIALGNLSSEFDRDSTRPWNRTGASTVAGWMQIFRYTGDMVLLDESVRLMELAWNRMSTSDGRRFWSEYDQILDTGLAAGHVALVAWVCHNNRDLQSPAGHDYGAIADKYKNWLLTDHIPHWKTNSSLPPYDKYQGHTYLYTTRLMHYLGKLGGGGGYTQGQFEAAVTDMVTLLIAGDAYGNIGFENRPVRLHKHVIADSTSPTGNVLQYTTYVRYEITAVIDLALDGADARFDESFLTSWANAYADFVLDGDPENTGDPGARTIGGDLVEGSSLLGIDYNGTYRGRISASRLVTSAYNYLGGWDARNHAEPYVFAFYPGGGSSTTPTYSDFSSSRVFNLFHHGK